MHEGRMGDERPVRSTPAPPTVHGHLPTSLKGRARHNDEEPPAPEPPRGDFDADPRLTPAARLISRRISGNGSFIRHAAEAHRPPATRRDSIIMTAASHDHEAEQAVLGSILLDKK